MSFEDDISVVSGRYIITVVRTLCHLAYKLELQKWTYFWTSKSVQHRIRADVHICIWITHCIISTTTSLALTPSASMSDKQPRDEQLSDCTSIAKVSWPKCGKNSQFLTLTIPHCSDALCKEALLFVCNHWCYMTSKQYRRFITMLGIYRDKEVLK